MNFTGFTQKIEVSFNISANYTVIPDLVPDIPKDTVPVGYIIIIPGKPNITQPWIENYESGAGFKAGIDFTCNIYKSLFLSTGMGFRMINFTRTIQYIPDIIRSIQGNTIIIQGSADRKTLQSETAKMFYVDIPITAGYKLFNDRLWVNAGISASFLAYSIIEKKGLLDNKYFNYSEKTYKNCDGLTNFLVFLQAGVEYNFYKRFSLFANYSRCLSAIYDEQSRYSGKAKYNLLEAGVSIRML